MIGGIARMRAHAAGLAWFAPAEPNMKRWALLVVLLYGLILAIVLFDALVLAFLPESVRGLRKLVEIRNNDAAYFWAALSTWVLVLGLVQMCLLVVPVRMAAGRPVKHRHVIWPLLAAMVMLGLMASAMWLAVAETLDNTQWATDATWPAAAGVTFAMWLIWLLIFPFYVGVREPRTFMSRLARMLLAGSILELLIAVPAHVIARVRDYCCAGFGTFVGLAAGLSVMLLAFGPAVFFLLLRRVQSLRRLPPQRNDETRSPNDE